MSYHDKLYPYFVYRSTDFYFFSFQEICLAASYLSSPMIIIDIVQNSQVMINAKKANSIFYLTLQRTNNSLSRAGFQLQLRI